MTNRPMTPNRAFIVDCRIVPDVDESESALRDVLGEMQVSDVTPAEHDCSEVRLSNVGKLSWTGEKWAEEDLPKSSA